jgi:hypothetical protein
MSEHTLRRIRRVTVSLVAAFLAVAGLASVAVARTPVDPNTLNPAPPDFFNASCYAGGGGTICDLAFADPENPFLDEPSGVVCGGTELLLTQNRFVIGKRVYDTNGNLVQRHFRESITGVLTNPDTGKSVPWIQHDTVIQNLTVHGDLDSGITSFTGLYSRFYLPHGGTILMDAGTFSQDVNGPVSEAGQHPINDYFAGDTAAFVPVCDAVS